MVIEIEVHRVKWFDIYLLSGSCGSSPPGETPLFFSSVPLLIVFKTFGNPRVVIGSEFIVYSENKLPQGAF